MLATTLLFLIIQVPASWEEAQGVDTKGQSRAESTAALIGLLASVAAFLGYLVYCFRDASEDKQLAEVVKGIHSKRISISAALAFVQRTSKSSSDRETSLVQSEQMARLE